MEEKCTLEIKVRDASMVWAAEEAGYIAQTLEDSGYRKILQEAHEDFILILMEEY